MNVVESCALRKSYGSHPAVCSLDLEVPQGCVFGLIGPNGAGKTTVLRMLLDIIRPTSGDLWVLGTQPRQARAALRRRIGYLPGELRLGGRQSGRAFLNHLAEISGPVPKGCVEQLAERLDLDLRQAIRELSRGNKQKLGLVQAFMHHPELLILDEPTSGLDPLIQREFLAMVREAREDGQTVLLSSHILSEIQQGADEVMVLAHGQAVASGDVASLRLHSVSHLRAVISGGTEPAVRQALTGVPGLSDLTVVDGESIRVSASLCGEIDPLIKALAGFHVRDLTLEEPDLEESVLNLYSGMEDHR